jgi:cytochrome c-type biogenesis protein CcmF
VYSVRSVATRGVFILGFLGVVVGASLTLYAWRAPAIRSTAHFALLSRESLLLANNLLLIVACASVLLGTLYPLALEGLGGGKISVGPPYFNTVFVPPMLLLALLLGLGPLVSWRRGDRAQLLRRMRWLAAGGVVAAGLAAVLALGGAGLGVLIALFMAGWITASVVYNLFLRSAPGRRLASLANVPLGVWAMNLAHLGMAVFIAGVAVVSVYGEEHTIGLAPGESDDIAGYHFEFTSLKPVQGPNYEAMRGEFRIFRSGEHIGTVYPEKRRYEVQQSAMTEAGIQGNFSRDLFVALGEPLSNGAWSVRIQYKPMIRWIWLGALMMALGGLLAASDRRYRISARRSLARQANIEQGATP